VASRYSFDQMVSAFDRIYREQLAVHAPVHLSASEMMAS
jgi:hypothetical protein